MHLYQIFVYIQQPTKDIQFTHQSREELLHKIIRVGFIISLHLLIHKSKHIEGTGNNMLVIRQTANMSRWAERGARCAIIAFWGRTELGLAVVLLTKIGGFDKNTMAGVNGAPKFTIRKTMIFPYFDPVTVTKMRWDRRVKHSAGMLGETSSSVANKC